jgi:hypothetical protein
MKPTSSPSSSRLRGGHLVSRHASLFRHCARASLILSAAATAHASTWDGGSIVDDLWSTAENWNDNTVPLTGADLTFDGEVQIANTNDLHTNFVTGTPAALLVNSVSFAATAGPFYLQGNALDLGGKTITNNSSNLQAFGMTLQVDEDLTGGLVVNAATGDIEINSLALRNGFNEFLDKTGPQTLFINGPLIGSDTFHARVQQGTMVASSGGNLFFNATVSAGATLRTGGASASGIIHNGGALTLNGTLDLAQGVSEDIGNLSGGGLVTNQGAAGTTSKLTLRSSSNNTFSGIIQDGPDGGTTSLQIGMPATSGSISTASGKLTLTGAHTYTGNTILGQTTGLVSLQLTDTSSLKFKIGASGVNTRITGSFLQTSGTVALDGSFIIDLASAERIHNNSWTLVDVTNLNETYGASFNVAAPFTESSPGVWTYVDGLAPAGTWTFTESSGVLIFQEAAGRPPVTTWDGGGIDALWSNADNWDTPPLTNDDLVFDGSTQTTNTNDLDTGYDSGTSTPGTFVVDSIVFAPTAGPFTLQGNAIDYSGKTITNHSANTQTFDLQIQIDEDAEGLTVNTAGGDVVLNSLALRNGFNETLLKTGPETLHVNGPLADSATFAAQVSQGTMVANSSGNLFFNGTIAAGATLRTGGSSPSGVFHNGGTLTLNGTLDLAEGVIEDIGTVNGSGVVTNHGAAGTSSTLRLRLGTNQTFSGTIQNAASGATTALEIGLDPSRTEGGVFTLSGANTYTGSTTFNQTEASLLLAATGSMAFAPGAAGACNKITALASQVTGTVTLEGTFNIDLGGAAIANGNSWQIVDTVLLPSTTFGATFNVAGFTEASNVWTKVEGANTWSFQESSGVLSLSTGGGSNYSSWAAANGIPGEAADGDFDKDGLSNLIEYALGTSPTASSGPAGTHADGIVSFPKGAEAVANGDISWVIQESNDLGVTDAWVTVTPTVNNSTTISYTLPSGGPKVFVRLLVGE